MSDYLEAVSDKIRRGEPVSFIDAIAAINYQEQLRSAREANSIFGRLKRFFARLRAPAPTPKEPTP